MIVYVSQECDYHSDKQEKKLPRHVHIASPPLIIMKGEKELFAPFWSREATATVWLSPGAFGTAYIISFYFIAVNIF